MIVAMWRYALIGKLSAGISKHHTSFSPPMIAFCRQVKDQPPAHLHQPAPDPCTPTLLRVLDAQVRGHDQPAGTMRVAPLDQVVETLAVPIRVLLRAEVVDHQDWKAHYPVDDVYVRLFRVFVVRLTDLAEEFVRLDDSSAHSLFKVLSAGHNSEMRLPGAGSN